MPPVVLAGGLAAMVADSEFLTATPQVQEIYEGLKFDHDYGGVKAAGTIEVENASYKAIFADARVTFDQVLGSQVYGATGWTAVPAEPRPEEIIELTAG